MERNRWSFLRVLGFNLKPRMDRRERCKLGGDLKSGKKAGHFAFEFHRGDGASK
jgi:hypothetical protein